MTSDPTLPLWLFVRLQLERAALPAYLAAMQAEVRGARGEAGNHSFDLFTPPSTAPDVATLFLLECWRDHRALHDEHARQPYYQHMRDLEATALTAAVDEWELAPCPPAPAPGADKTLSGPWTRVTLLHADGATVATQMDEKWAAAAAPLRSAAGHVASALFSRGGIPGDRLLVESWNSPEAANEGWLSAAHKFSHVLHDARWATIHTLHVTDRSNT